MVRNVVFHRILLLAILIRGAGCESGDGRLVEHARQATEQQAKQNQQMAEQAEAVARQSQELAATAHELVKEDAAARREVLKAQQQLHEHFHEERSRLDKHHQEVYAEKKATIEAAVREPVIAEAVITAGLILAALLPLLVTAYAMRRLPERDPVDELLVETILEDLFTVQDSSPTQEPPAPALLDSAALNDDGQTPFTTDGDPPVQ